MKAVWTTFVAPAILMLGQVGLSNGQSQPQPQAESNLQKQIEEERKGAEQGDAKSQFNLAFSYQWGIGTKMDYVEAAKWYLKAAEQGNLLAQSTLASMYRDGKGVSQNYGQAANWYRRAADNEVVEKTGVISTKATSADSLGTLYEKGLGVPQDYAEAARWYRNAVVGGYDLGTFSMYSLCFHGKATKRDCADVVEWLSILADRDDSALYPAVRAVQGSNVSQLYLGTLYEKGLGVPQNYVEAARWYRKAADWGNATAQFSLAYLYLRGVGVPQDLVAAHMWFNLSAALDPDGESQKDTAKIRDEVAKMMTPAQIAEAQRLAREWKPSAAK